MTKHRDELLTRVRVGVTLGPSRRARLRKAIVGGVMGASAAGAAQAASAQAAMQSGSLPMLALPTSLKVLAVALVATGGLAWSLSLEAPDPDPSGAVVAVAASEAPALATPSTAPTASGLPSPEQPSSVVPSSVVPSPGLAPSPPPVAAPVARRERAPRDRADTPRSEAPETAPAAIAAVAAEVPVPDPLGRETTLLRNARSALAHGDVGRAVSLLDEHARDFPDGALAEARDLLRVQARCVAGDGEGAAREAAHFVDAHPSSPHARRMASPCEGRSAR